MNRTLATFLVLTAVLVGTLAWGFSAETAKAMQFLDSTERTVLDGVYTAAQAARGRADFITSCSGCHIVGDTGINSAPPLVGDWFMERYREYDLELPFSIIKNSMPLNLEGSLDDNTYVDIFAYILEGNGFPAGNQELTFDMLGSIRLVGRDGPKPLPTGSLVLSVGCLIRSSGDSWMLINASRPTRSKTFPYRTTPEELESSETKPLGTETFLLGDIHYIPGFNPEPNQGRKVQAKGLLVRQPDIDLVSLTSLEILGSDCG